MTVNIPGASANLPHFINAEVQMTTHSTTALSDDSPVTLASQTSLARTFKQPHRTPLIPESVLKRHGAYCAVDTRFRAAARLQQAIWLKEQNITTAADDHAGKNVHSFLGSILSAEAARAGKNFFSADMPDYCSE
jgi:hypothetical protein